MTGRPLTTRLGPRTYFGRLRLLLWDLFSLLDLVYSVVDEETHLEV
jgi:hypothetical protein